MRFRTKLFAAFFLVAVISALSGLFIMYEGSNKILFNELRSKATSLVTTAAAQLDPDLIAQLQGHPQDETNTAYLKLQNELRQLRNANRRYDIYVRYLYLIRPAENKDWVFLVDAEENPKLVSHPGDPMPHSDVKILNENLQTPYTDTFYVRDQWGTWLSAYAPIYNKAGYYVGSLGLDLSASDIDAELNRLILAGFTALLASVVIALIVAFWLSSLAVRPLGILCGVVEEIGKGNLDSHIELGTKDEFSHLADAINVMSHGLREREHLKTNFARYVSSQVLDKILHGEAATKVEGERRKITVLFSDIRQFTQLSETMPPEQVVSLLNEYFDRMIDVIFSNFGTLDKFIGDGIMVEFGTPLDDPLQEEHAVQAALGMMEALKKLNAEWLKQSKTNFRIGIGIHTGLAIVGNIGSEKRMEYTAIGDTVNVAARLEQLTKQLQKGILISETTYMGLQRRFTCQSLGMVQLPGRLEPIHIFTPEAFSFEPPPSETH